MEQLDKARDAVDRQEGWIDRALRRAAGALNDLADSGHSARWVAGAAIVLLLTLVVMVLRG